MKKSLLKRLDSKLKPFLVAVIIGISSVQSFAQATDPNPFFAFKKIYIEPVKDNLDGAFRQSFESAYKEVFEKNPRFELVSSLEQADSVLHTTVEKTPMTINCGVSLQVHSGSEKDTQENLFTSEKTTIKLQADDTEIRSSAKKVLKTILKRIPFYGTVSGREETVLTFDIGSLSGLKKGDVVQISRVDAVRKHPLLKTILDVSLVPVGTAEIESVETSISFGRVREEFAGEKIQRFFKVTSVDSRGEDSSPVKIPEEGFSAEKGKIESEDYAKPEIGFVGVGPFLGFLSYSASQNNGVTSPNGTGFNPGVKLFSEVWLTKNWFIAADAGYSAASIALKNTVTSSATSNFSTTSHNVAFDFGYRHFLWNTIRGPSVYGRLGYNSFTWSTPVDTTYLVGPKTFSGWRLGLGGSIPMHKNKQFGLLMALNLGLFPGYTQTGSDLSPDPTQIASASSVSFNLGMYNYFLENMAIRMMFCLDVNSVEYSGGANGYGTSNASVKQIGILPSILYYF